MSSLLAPRACKEDDQVGLKSQMNLVWSGAGPVTKSRPHFLSFPSSASPQKGGHASAFVISWCFLVNCLLRNSLMISLFALVQLGSWSLSRALLWCGVVWQSGRHYFVYCFTWLGPFAPLEICWLTTDDDWLFWINIIVLFTWVWKLPSLCPFYTNRSFKWYFMVGSIVFSFLSEGGFLISPQLHSLVDVHFLGWVKNEGWSSFFLNCIKFAPYSLLLQ